MFIKIGEKDMEELQTIKYITNNVELNIRVDYEEETVWLTTEQIAILFDKERTVISKNIKKIFTKKELEESSVCANFAHTASDGKTYNVKHYNLEIVILIGNKIDQKKTSEFKEYVLDIIKEYKKAHKRYEIVKFIDKTLEIDVNIDPDEETVWLTQNEIAELFGKDRKTISRHINNIFEEFELMENSVCSKKEHTGLDGKEYMVNIYNLDMIIAIGYRVKSKRAILFRKWASKVLKEYLLKGFVINEKRVMVTEDNYNNLVTQVNDLKTSNINVNNKLEIVDNRLANIEKKIEEYNIPVSQIFFNGQFYDAYTLIQKIFESASSEIIIIDNYIDRSILDRLVVKKPNVLVNIYTNINAKLLGSDIKTFNNQYGGLSVIYTTKVHDRYIIIDNKDLYLVGGSIKDLGKKITTVVNLDSKFINTIINTL